MGGCCQTNVERTEIFQPENQSKMRKAPIAKHRKTFRCFENFKDAMNAYQEIVSKLENGKEKWRDPEFPPIFEETIRTPKQYIYKRISDIISGVPIVFDDINPNDIQQGALENWHFLSALSALAETPSRVKSLFTTSEGSKHGIYMIKLCLLGIWRYFFIDDYFPVTSTGRLAFSKCVGNEIWVLLLEKAYAKFYGSYQAISTGDPCEAMNDLSGAPSFSVKIGESPEELWNQLSFFDEKNYLMILIASEKPELKEKGLAMGHAYTLIGIQEVQTQFETHRLVKMRNPLGFEWNGDWSNNSEKWTKDLKKKVEFGDKSEGVFFISVEDCFRFFEGMQVCKYYDDYTLTGVLIDPESSHVGGKAFLFEFSSEMDNHGFISGNYDTADSYNVCFINVFEDDKEEMDQTRSAFYGKGMERNIQVEFEVEKAGKLTVLVYSPSGMPPVSLSVYSKEAVEGLKQIQSVPGKILTSLLSSAKFH